MRQAYALIEQIAPDLPPEGEPVDSAQLEPPAQLELEVQLFVRRGKKLKPIPPKKLGEDDQITVIVPAMSGTHYALQLPPGKLSDLERAAAYMLEDKLASPVEDVFISLAQPGKSGATRDVYLTETELFEALHNHKALAGRNWRLVSPLSLLEPGVAVEFDGCAIFHDGERRFALDADLPEDLRNHCLSAFSARTDIQVHGASLADYFSVQPTSEKTGLEWCAAGIEADMALKSVPDLRQGRFAPRRFLIPNLNEMRAAALGVVLVLAGGVLAQILSAWRAESLSQSLDAQIETISAQVAPDRPTLRNAEEVRALKPASIGSAAKADGLAMLSDVYAALEDLDGVTLSEVNFDRNTGQLQVVIIYSDFGLDTQVKTYLEKYYKVMLGDVRSQRGAVTGNLVLEMR